MKIKKAIIPAAGLGTRMLPATKSMPKEMLPVFDKPTLQYIIEEAISSGIEEILIVTGRNKQSIENHFDKSVELELELEKSKKYELLEQIRKISEFCDIHYIRQREPKGLGHAIYRAKTFISNDPFAVLLGDDIVYSKKPCLKQLIEVYEEKNSPILGVQRVKKEDVNKYGIVYGEKVSEKLTLVENMVEKPQVEEAKSDIAILGRYIITSDIFEALEQTSPGKNGEIQITDALYTLMQKRAIYAYEFDGKRYDLGDKLGLLKASIEFGLRDETSENEIKEYLKNLNDTDYKID